MMTVRMFKMMMMTIMTMVVKMMIILTTMMMITMIMIYFVSKLDGVCWINVPSSKVPQVDSDQEKY